MREIVYWGGNTPIRLLLGEFETWLFNLTTVGMSVCDIAGVGNLYKKNVIKCLENINLNVWLGIH